METSMIQPLVASAIAAAIAIRSYRKKSLDLSGAFSGFAVMAIHIAVNYRFGAVLLVFFFTSSMFTIFGEDKKKKVEADFQPMKKSTHRSKREKKSAKKRRLSRLKFLHEELAKSDHHRDDNELVDRISELPDDILIIILSRLTLKKAIATSVLSTRWRYLHTYINHLKFPPFSLKSGEYKELFSSSAPQVKVPHYETIINKTLDSYRGNGVLEEFRLEMDFKPGTKIEGWLEFAFDRLVEKIDIRMRHGIGINIGDFYILRLSNLVERALPGLKCLKQLCLHGVRVDDLVIRLMLSNFSLLERLTIQFSSFKSSNVSFLGHGLVPQLKHLDISHITYLRLVEIRDMVNLVSFRCCGIETRYFLQLSNLPKLAEFDITEEHPKGALAVLLPTMPSYIRDQLRVIKVWINQPFRQFLPVDELKNVKHLMLKVNMCELYCWTHLFFLIEACSSLEKLEMEFSWLLRDTKGVGHFEMFEYSPRKYCPNPKYLTRKFSPNLKNLTMSGYVGSMAEWSLALFMIENVASLEELSVEPCGLTRKIRRMSTTRAWKQLKLITPKSVNLVIL